MAGVTAEYPLGTNNVFYKAKGFNAEKQVTCFIWNPRLEKSDEILLTALEYGLYFFNFYFQDVGIYNAIFLEDGEPSRFHAFRVGHRSLRLP